MIKNERPRHEPKCHWFRAIKLTCTTSSLDSKSDMMVSLPSSIRVMATASRPLARWCALEGRCLCKTISNQWITLTEGLNGPSMKAFNCLAKLIISSRMETATQNTVSEEMCIEDIDVGEKKKPLTQADFTHHSSGYQGPCRCTQDKRGWADLPGSII